MGLAKIFKMKFANRERSGLTLLYCGGRLAFIDTSVCLVIWRGQEAKKIFVLVGRNKFAISK